MVLIHCKGKSDDHQFLYETTTSTPVSTVVRELVEIHNSGCIQRLKVEGDELAQHGPARHPDKQGLDEDLQADADGVLSLSAADVLQGPERQAGRQRPRGAGGDDAPRRLWTTPRTASKSRSPSARGDHQEELLDAIDVVRGAVMIAYPMGIPEWDPVRMDIEADEKPGDTPSSVDVLDPDAAQLWWAGKQMIAANKLAAHVGANEKTKIIAKLTKKGGGAPQREAPVSAEEQKAMMAYYHRRQEEMAALEANQEDDYANSAWANSGALKAHFSGAGNGGDSLGDREKRVQLDRST